jgi:hypothetical protein
MRAPGDADARKEPGTTTAEEHSMRQSARFSAGTGYGSPETVVATQAPRAPSGALPLLILVIALAGATVWFVAVPALDKPVRSERSCEVIVLESGTTKCVRDPTRGSRTEHRKQATRGA